MIGEDNSDKEYNAEIVERTSDVMKAINSGKEARLKSINFHGTERLKPVPEGEEGFAEYHKPMDGSQTDRVDSEHIAVYCLGTISLPEAQKKILHAVDREGASVELVEPL